MKKLILFAMIIMASNVWAGFGRGGSSGGRSFSSGSSFRSSGGYSRSYSSPSYSRSYSSPSRSYSSHTVVHHNAGGSGIGGVGSHLGAGALGYMMGANSRPQGYVAAPPAYINGVAQSAAPMPVDQPVYDNSQHYYGEGADQRSIMGTIFWTLFWCFAITVVLYLIIKWRENNDHSTH